MADSLERWQAFACRLEIPPEKAATLYVEIENHYGEPHRYYHTLPHILDMLDGRDALGADGFALEAAIWFHDVIYNPKSAENEKKSAEFAAEGLSDIKDPVFHTDLERLILITDHRDAPQMDDERIVCDLDLMILGRNEESYRTYTSAIRQEFAHVPDDLFNRARRSVLQAFLDRPTIYFMEPMRDQFEKQARENLSRELEELAPQA